MVIQPNQCSHIPITGHCQKGYHCKPYSDNCFLCKTIQEKCDKGKVLVGVPCTGLSNKNTQYCATGCSPQDGFFCSIDHYCNSEHICVNSGYERSQAVPQTIHKNNTQMVPQTIHKNNTQTVPQMIHKNNAVVYQNNTLVYQNNTTVQNHDFLLVVVFTTSCLLLLFIIIFCVISWKRIWKMFGKIQCSPKTMDTLLKLDESVYESNDILIHEIKNNQEITNDQEITNNPTKCVTIPLNPFSYHNISEPPTFVATGQLIYI